MRLRSLEWLVFLVVPLCVGAAGCIVVALSSAAGSEADARKRQDAPDEMRDAGRLSDRARTFARELRRRASVADSGEAHEPAE
jgi:hypothetical protein